MREILFDASALVCLILQEPGCDVAEKHYQNGCITSINYAEAGTVFVNKGFSPDESAAILNELDIDIIDVDKDLATKAFLLREHTRPHGLSLGDRVCLAAAMLNGLPVLTGDRAWKNLDLGLDIRFIRSS